MTLDFETIVRWLNTLYTIPKIGLVFAGCLAFGLVIKKTPWIHNSAIPLCVTLWGMIWLPLLSDWPDSSVKTVTRFIALNLFIGMIVGVTAVATHHFLLKPLMNKMGIKSFDTKPPFPDPPAPDPKERINPPRPPPVK